MAVERTLHTPEAEQLLELTEEIVAKEISPRVAEDEENSVFPRQVFTTLGQAGLLGLPYPGEYGGGDQPYEVYLQVVEELARGWLAVGLGVSVHTLSCYPLATFGSAEQKTAHLPDMVGGGLLGAYCLSETTSGSDAAAMNTRAETTETGYRINGAKAWITHGGHADYYALFARTGTPDSGARGISCFHVPADASGLSSAAPERKMGMRSSPTAGVLFDDVELGTEALIGERDRGFGIALSALDSGRLGIAACAVGLAQAALDAAVSYSRERHQFGSAIGDFQGLSFMLADMATQVAASRELYLSAARLRDAGRPFGKQAAMAKLMATDTAMKVTTDAVQVFGGYGYTRDFPVERYMREAKVLQIVEGTNQVQRLVIGRHLAKEA
ncbi:acyl-CoA dehydrogenase family protein [Nocardiopsis alkaliphila]|uniref:acyl-CoA dehydrogenase family protein n=1 Tax=Nocardiopsis alkaliphila TaxID=225762 RepID=UPI00034B1279|nr:acyl-CoA dehydrogenase family protein [Nocardiopsis alkaliphila]